MKKIVSFLILLVLGLSSYGQTIPRPQPSAAGIGYKRLLADSTLFFPAQSGIPSGMIALKSNNINRKPSILADTTNNNFYWFNPKDSIWRRLIADTELAGYVPYTGAVASVNLGEFRLTSRSIATDSILARSSAGGRIVSNSGTTVAEWGVGGGSNIDFHGFAGYNANRSSSYTDRSFTDKGYVDSSAALKYGGSVTTNTIPKATAANTFGNSQIFDNGTSVGINTITPTERLTVANTSSPDIIAAHRLSSTLGANSGYVFSHNNASGGKVNTAGIYSRMSSNTAGSESADISFFTRLSGATAERMTLSSAGNLGLAVTLSPWGNLTRALQLGNTGASIWGYTAAGTNSEFIFVSNNTYNDNTNNIYIRDGEAAMYRQLGGQHAWFYAPSGIIGGTATMTQAMTLNNANRLLLGLTVDDGGNIFQANGSARFVGGVTAQRFRGTSLVVNKDSLPINTSQVWFATADTTGAAGTNRVGRRNLSNVLTSSITFDTTTRVLSIPTLAGGSSSVVIPRGTASGSSGIVALSSSRSGNLVTVSGDNGSTTTFSIRDADSTTRANLIAGNGLSGSSYNGVSAVTWTADTTVLSTKNNVDAGLVTKVNVNDTSAMLGGYARLSGATFTDAIRGTVGIFQEKLTANNTISVKNVVDTPTVQLSWSGTDNGVIGVYSGGGAAKIAIVGSGTSYFNGGKVLVGTTTESPDNEEFQVSGAALVSGAMKASSFARIGGTSSQFQMGDGSVRLLGVMPISLKTANYTLTTNDHTVIFDCSAANRTVTLPVGVEGQIFVIKAKNASTNAAIITPNGSQTIEGNSTYSLSNTCGDAAITIQFLSGNWNIISSYLPPCL